MRVSVDQESLDKIKSLIDEGWSFNYASGRVGMNRNHQAALINMCKEYRELREYYSKRRGRHQITDRIERAL